MGQFAHFLKICMSSELVLLHILSGLVGISCTWWKTFPLLWLWNSSYTNYICIYKNLCWFFIWFIEKLFPIPLFNNHHSCKTNMHLFLESWWVCLQAKNKQISLYEIQCLSIVCKIYVMFYLYYIGKNCQPRSDGLVLSLKTLPVVWKQLRGLE